MATHRRDDLPLFADNATVEEEGGKVILELRHGCHVVAQKASALSKVVMNKIADQRSGWWLFVVVVVVRWYSLLESPGGVHRCLQRLGGLHPQWFPTLSVGIA